MRKADRWIHRVLLTAGVLALAGVGCTEANTDTAAAAGGAGVRYLENAEQFAESTAQGTVLVDFYADWCGPCKMMAPIVEALSEELSDVKVCHINIDENIDIAQKYRVMSIPTFIAFKGGEESGRQIGAIPKTALVDLVK